MIESCRSKHTSSQLTEAPTKADVSTSVLGRGQEPPSAYASVDRLKNSGGGGLPPRTGHLLSFEVFRLASSHLQQDCSILDTSD